MFSAEGFLLSSRLRAEKFPFLCVLAPGSNQQLICLERIQGFVSAESLVDTLTRVTTAFESLQAAEVARRNENL